MKCKYYWIKERHNPQLGVYYIPCGKMSVKEAKKMESSPYGDNYMHKFTSIGDYEAKIRELEALGERVHKMHDTASSLPPTRKDNQNDNRTLPNRNRNLARK